MFKQNNIASQRGSGSEQDRNRQQQQHTASPHIPLVSPLSTLHDSLCSARCVYFAINNKSFRRIQIQIWISISIWISFLFVSFLVSRFVSLLFLFRFVWSATPQENNKTECQKAKRNRKRKVAKNVCGHFTSLKKWRRKTRTAIRAANLKGVFYISYIHIYK